MCVQMYLTSGKRALLECSQQWGKIYILYEPEFRMYPHRVLIRAFTLFRRRVSGLNYIRTRIPWPSLSCVNWTGRGEQSNNTSMGRQTNFTDLPPVINFAEESMHSQRRPKFWSVPRIPVRSCITGYSSYLGITESGNDLCGRRTFLGFGLPAFQHESPNRIQDTSRFCRAPAVHDTKHDCDIGEFGKWNGSHEYLRWNDSYNSGSWI